ncbi:unnamed protein product [Pieris macdunnoughi]|uniref:Uncharacterized protein n=1 Tax=Pieris macdunnoughi TaxID=345717 RepID=A0A821P8J6_9NEOP|nr:unnamed protein product [Pieris macdunnoughi]
MLHRPVKNISLNSHPRTAPDVVKFTVQNVQPWESSVTTATSRTTLPSVAAACKCIVNSVANLILTNPPILPSQPTRKPLISTLTNIINKSYEDSDT